MKCKYCDAETVHGTGVCLKHGGHQIKTGTDAPNYRTGEYTKEAMERSRAFRKRLRELHELGYALGMFKNKMRGRKPYE